jgi:site-specific recombinase XerC
VNADTNAHYIAQLRKLIPPGQVYLRSAFTSAAIASWLTTRTALVQKRKASTLAKPRRKKDPPARSVTGSTKRKYLGAVRSVATCLLEIGVLSSNPVRDVQAPPPGRPRVVEIDLNDVRRIVEGALPPYRAVYALLYGAGLDISAALACIDSDVDVERREVRARGTKATRETALYEQPSGRGQTSRSIWTRSRQASVSFAASIDRTSASLTVIGSSL